MKITLLLSAALCIGSFSFSQVCRKGELTEIPQTNILAADPDEVEIRSCCFLPCRIYNPVQNRNYLVELLAPVETENQVRVSVNVYPNPVSVSFQVKTSEAIDVNSLSIFDLTGKCLFENTSFVMERDRVNVSTLPNGVYIARLNSGGKIYNEQFIVNR